MPFQIDPSGRVAEVRGRKAVVSQQVAAAVSTQLGERVMRPTYGMQSEALLFDPVDDLFVGQLNADIRDVLRIWEPDVEVRGVQVSEAGSGDLSGAAAEVHYSIRGAAGSVTELGVATIDVGGGVEEVRGG